ncbi:hypothetical protein LCGC14_0267950 [marine sediment metagenome]|uniref:Uncharacterized protein n=1 Tax=marine sediment metagenome TaxID=412755 RepID=A0A0F9U4R5_9ZZZZ
MSTNFYLRKYVANIMEELHLGKQQNDAGKDRPFLCNFQQSTLKTLIRDGWRIFDEYDHPFSWNQFIDEMDDQMPFIYPGFPYDEPHQILEDWF